MKRREGKIEQQVDISRGRGREGAYQKTRGGGEMERREGRRGAVR